VPGEVGPDVEWIDASTTPSIHTVPTSSLPPRGAIGPALKDGALQPGYAGIRPRPCRRRAGQDFVVQGPAEHGGVAGLIISSGIEIARPHLLAGLG